MADTLDKTLEEFRKRKFIIIHDDFAPPSRGIIVSPGQEICAELVNQALHLTGGLCFVAISKDRAGALMLSPMQRPAKLSANQRQQQLPMCISVEAREGVTTGISAADRAATILCLASPSPSPRALVNPGHIFPIETKDGGILVKNSLPEAALDIVKIAGFSDAALYLDLMNNRGDFLSPEEQLMLAQEQSIPLIRLSQLVQYRLQHEPLVTRFAEAKLPSVFGENIRAIIYRSLLDDAEHLALVKGNPNQFSPSLVRVQAESTFSDVFGGDHPATREQIHSALRLIDSQESGVLLYLRGASQRNILQHIGVQRESAATERPPALMREYGLGAQILRDLGVSDAIILSNHRGSLIGLESFGIKVRETRPLTFTSHEGTSEQ